MSGSALGATLALLAIPLAGLPYGLQLGLRGPLLAAAAWLLGCGMVAGGMLALSLLHVPFARASLGLLWVFLVAPGARLLSLQRGAGVGRVMAAHAGSLLPSFRKLERRPRAPSPWCSISGLLAAICLLQILYTVLVAVRVPLGSFDSWSLWAFKGRAFWLDRGMSGTLLHDRSIIFAHPAYPPLLPLLIAWIYTWAGSADPVLMKPIYPLFYCALLLAFYAAVRARLDSRAALPATALLTLVPRLTEYAGTGLADVPMAAYLVAAAAAVSALAQPDRKRALAAGILLGLAMATKREGLFFFLAASGTLFLMERSWRRLAHWLWPCLLVGLPWYLYVGLSGVPDRDFLPITPAAVAAHADRIGAVARLFLFNSLALDEWGLLWYVFGAVLLLALPRRRLHAPALLPTIVVPLALYVGALSLSAWPDADLHARTSLDRLILVTAPFALWFVCEQLLPASTSPPRPAAHPPIPGRDTGL